MTDDGRLMTAASHSLDRSLQHREASGQLSDWLESLLNPRHPRVGMRSDFAILALDKRRDLLQEDDQRRRQRQQIVAPGRRLRARRENGAIERRQRVVVAVVGLAALAL